MSEEQDHLFDLSEECPTRGELRAKRAAERRKEKAVRSEKWRRKNSERDRARREKERLYPSKSCCIHWYAAGHGMDYCSNCKEPISLTAIRDRDERGITYEDKHPT